MQVYVDDDRYILTNVLLDGEKQPISFLGTRSLKMAPSDMDRMSAMLDQIAKEPSVGYEASGSKGKSQNTERWTFSNYSFRAGLIGGICVTSAFTIFAGIYFYWRK